MRSSASSSSAVVGAAHPALAVDEHEPVAVQDRRAGVFGRRLDRQQEALAHQLPDRRPLAGQEEPVAGLDLPAFGVARSAPPAVSCSGSTEIESSRTVELSGRRFSSSFMRAVRRRAGGRTAREDEVDDRTGGRRGPPCRASRRCARVSANSGSSESTGSGSGAGQAATAGAPTATARGRDERPPASAGAAHPAVHRRNRWSTTGDAEDRRQVEDRDEQEPPRGRHRLRRARRATAAARKATPKTQRAGEMHRAGDADRRGHERHRHQRHRLEHRLLAGRAGRRDRSTVSSGIPARR